MTLLGIMWDITQWIGYYLEYNTYSEPEIKDLITGSSKDYLKDYLLYRSRVPLCMHA